MSGAADLLDLSLHLRTVPGRLGSSRVRSERLCTRR